MFCTPDCKRRCKKVSVHKYCGVLKINFFSEGGELFKVIGCTHSSLGQCYYPITRPASMSEIVDYGKCESSWGRVYICACNDIRCGRETKPAYTRDGAVINWNERMSGKRQGSTSKS